MPKKGYKQTLEHRKNSSLSHLGQDTSHHTRFKKGQEAWNFKTGEKKKRKFKRLNGKLVLNSHHVFCTHHNILEIPKGFVIHHKDENSLNDDINNLIFMTDSGHKKLENQISKDILKAGKKLSDVNVGVSE